MAKRELKGNADIVPEPTVVLSRNKAPIQGTFVGEYVGLKHDAPVGAFNNKFIHQFAFKSSTFPIELKQGDKYVPVALDPNDLVIVFANKRVHASLLKAEKGMTIELIGNGEKLNPKTKRYFHDYTVNVVE